MAASARGANGGERKVIDINGYGVAWNCPMPRIVFTTISDNLRLRVDAHELGAW